MTLPPWALGIPSRELPLFGALGSREGLLEAFRSESDPAARVTALRALMAWEVGERRGDSGSSALLELLERCVADDGEPDVVRAAALVGLPLVSIDRARSILPGLLDVSPFARTKSIDLLEAVTFLEKAYASSPASALRAILTRHVAARVADPTTPAEDRKRGEALLKFST